MRRERNVNIERETDRAVLVLRREAQRAADCAERVRLVVEAVALRRGVGGRQEEVEGCDFSV